MMTYIRKCEEILLWSDILCHDATCHEAGHYMKWPGLAKVRNF